MSEGKPLPEEKQLSEEKEVAQPKNVLENGSSTGSAADEKQLAGGVGPTRDDLEFAQVHDRKYEKALVRKLDLHLLPILTLLYLLSFLDRSNGL